MIEIGPVQEAEYEGWSALKQSFLEIGPHQWRDFSGEPAEVHDARKAAGWYAREWGWVVRTPVSEDGRKLTVWRVA